MSTTTRTLQDGQRVVLTARSVLDRNRQARAAFRKPEGLFEVPGATDWTQGGAIDLPILGNNRAGDCMLVAGCHIDQAMRANLGDPARYDEPTVVQAYYRLSGGDHGLDEGTLVRAWSTQGLPGHPDARILDSLDIDVADPKLAHAALYLFGHVFFILSVPDRWIDTAAPGSLWDAPAQPDPANGHGVCLLGCDDDGRYDVATWGFLLKLTQAGVRSCDASGFVVFTPRWFDAHGFAPNGLHYTQVARLWVQAGGQPPPPSPYPDPLLPA